MTTDQRLETQSSAVRRLLAAAVGFVLALLGLAWRAANRPGDYFVNGTRDGVNIEVLIRNNEIWTGYPTNMPRNP